MSVAMTLSGDALAAVHEQFVAALPAMTNVIKFHFRRLPRGRRAEAIADAVAAAWHAWHGLLKRGQDPLDVGLTGIARNAARYTRAGRRLGTGTVGRGGMDVYHRRAQEQLGIKLISLDCHDETACGAPADSWRLWLALDNRVTPGDEAAFRIDFGRWLDLLPARKRQMAELLAEGHETGAVARQLGVTPAAVSQSRTWLEASWRRFQGESGPEAPRAPRAVGRPRKEDHNRRRRSQHRIGAPPRERASWTIGMA
jgi:hypothetical protein